MLTICEIRNKRFWVADNVCRKFFQRVKTCLIKARGDKNKTTKG